MVTKREFNKLYLVACQPGNDSEIAVSAQPLNGVDPNDHRAVADFAEMLVRLQQAGVLVSGASDDHATSRVRAFLDAAKGLPTTVTVIFSRQISEGISGGQNVAYVCAR